jgi:hypothetical protein
MEPARQSPDYKRFSNSVFLSPILATLFFKSHTYSCQLKESFPSTDHRKPESNLLYVLAKAWTAKLSGRPLFLRLEIGATTGRRKWLAKVERGYRRQRNDRERQPRFPANPRPILRAAHQRPQDEAAAQIDCEGAPGESRGPAVHDSHVKRIAGRWRLELPIPTQRIAAVF